jgi:hypothetical protein
MGSYRGILQGTPCLIRQRTDLAMLLNMARQELPAT